MATLEDDLEAACWEALHGDPPGSLLAGRLERVCQEVLRRHGVHGASVTAQSDRAGTAVHVTLPPLGRRVRQLVVRLA